MNKADLIEKIAEFTKTKKDAKAAVDTIFDSISSAMADGDTVSIIGFGTFKVSQRGAREGRNPRTGEKVHIAARKAPRFVPGKALKDNVNK